MTKKYDLECLVKKILLLDNNESCTLDRRDLSCLRVVMPFYDFEIAKKIICLKCRKEETFDEPNLDRMITFSRFLDEFSHEIMHLEQSISPDKEEAMKKMSKLSGYFIISLTCKSCNTISDIFFYYDNFKIKRLFENQIFKV